jgi:hypothetical protein
MSQFRISHVLRFISICDLLTDSPSYGVIMSAIYYFYERQSSSIYIVWRGIDMLLSVIRKEIQMRFILRTPGSRS